jgi:hypothetical protein
MAVDKSNVPEPLVRGISLLSTRRYLRSHLKEVEWEGLLENLHPHHREIIRTVEKGSWYPFDIQRIMREEIAKRFNPGNPRQAILDAYLEATDYEISTFLRGMFSFLPVKLVVGRAAALWGKYYRPGVMQSVDMGEKKVALELTEFPADNLFCPTVEAWLTNASKYQKLKNAKVQETACIHRGDDLCRWEVTWQ